MGTDFFTVEILTWRGFVTYYVLFLMKLGSGRVEIAGITRHPDEEWMQQAGRTKTRRNLGDTSTAAVTCFTIRIRNSATRSDPC